jgi:SAM-dependent methyltransferase
LYDALHAFESRRRNRGAYPVHKTLGDDANDIYEWILERVETTGVRHALDAGCGVGYGAILLAERLGCRVTGISLSERELGSATAAALYARLSDRIEFRRGSFDDLPAETYDLIVAVESLKHSGDLARTLQSLLTSLKRHGTLVVVDDCHEVRSYDSVERQLVADWELERLYGEHDFLARLDAMPHRVVDLTDLVRRNSRFAIALRLLGLEVARLFVGESTDRALRAFRGGLRLEQLYARRAMTYKAIFVERRGCVT